MKLLPEKNVMINDAINQGILVDAAEQANIVLKTMLEEMGFSHIYITEEFIIPQVH